MIIHRNIFRLLAVGIIFFIPFALLYAAAAPVQGSPSNLIPCGVDGPDPDTIVSGDEQCEWEDLITLAQNVINFLIFWIAAPLAAIMFAYAGFLYVTNQGNESQVQHAHQIFWYVFLGLVMALAAWLLVNYILIFFLGTNSDYNLLG